MTLKIASSVCPVSGKQEILKEISLCSHVQVYQPHSLNISIVKGVVQVTVIKTNDVFPLKMDLLLIHCQLTTLASYHFDY